MDVKRETQNQWHLKLRYPSTRFGDMFKRRNGKRKRLCYIKTRLVFTDKQEELEKYIRAASKIYFGLSPEETRNLSIQCAKRAFD